MRGATTRTSREVTHPSTTLPKARLSCGVTMGSGALVFGMIAPLWNRSCDAGSLEFQDFIGALVEAALVSAGGRNIGWIRGGERESDFGRGWNKI
ncbi:hypothetical protein OIU85_003422 [Salix viminalis]|uniref:Uncharacterized protein n=1 Tax=Salix viminalis TaxID=40686 RepID=A0A9Q0PZJ4_SALVM|nr:hypothetical protein OIU85_003422 [Salix viminalis]